MVTCSTDILTYNESSSFFSFGCRCSTYTTNSEHFDWVVSLNTTCIFNLAASAWSTLRHVFWPRMNQNSTTNTPRRHWRSRWKRKATILPTPTQTSRFVRHTTTHYDVGRRALINRVQLVSQLTIISRMRLAVWIARLYYNTFSSFSNWWRLVNYFVTAAMTLSISFCRY